MRRTGEKKSTSHRLLGGEHTLNSGYLASRLNQTYRQLLGDHELLTADHKQLKGELNQAKLEHTWLDADYSKLKKEFQQLDITTTKLTNQCEVLSVRPAVLHLSSFFAEVEENSAGHLADKRQKETKHTHTLKPNSHTHIV